MAPGKASFSARRIMEPEDIIGPDQLKLTTQIRDAILWHTVHQDKLDVLEALLELPPFRSSTPAAPLDERCLALHCSIVLGRDAIMQRLLQLPSVVASLPVDAASALRLALATASHVIVDRLMAYQCLKQYLEAATGRQLLNLWDSCCNDDNRRHFAANCDGHLARAILTAFSAPVHSGVAQLFQFYRGPDISPADAKEILRCCLAAPASDAPKLLEVALHALPSIHADFVMTVVTPQQARGVLVLVATYIPQIIAQRCAEDGFNPAQLTLVLKNLWTLYKSQILSVDRMRAILTEQLDEPFCCAAAQPFLQNILAKLDSSSPGVLT
jgi:hypothetical protein